jgi:hypothetical protein
VVKNIVRALTCRPTGRKIPNVALHHPEVSDSIEWGKDFVQVCAMASREVVDADNCLAQG